MKLIRALVGLAVFSFSMAANAIVLELSYEGEVSHVSGDGPDFSVGDVFAGSLLKPTGSKPTGSGQNQRGQTRLIDPLIWNNKKQNRSQNQRGKPAG